MCCELLLGRAAGLNGQPDLGAEPMPTPQPGGGGLTTQLTEPTLGVVCPQLPRRTALPICRRLTNECLVCSRGESAPQKSRCMKLEPPLTPTQLPRQPGRVRCGELGYWLRNRRDLVEMYCTHRRTGQPNSAEKAGARSGSRAPDHAFVGGSCRRINYSTGPGEFEILCDL